jgi:Lrp/AsnC family transcriptional regulator, leucine-responsive regulatory protein
MKTFDSIVCHKFIFSFYTWNDNAFIAFSITLRYAYPIQKARQKTEYNKKTDVILCDREGLAMLDQTDRMLLTLLKQDTRRKYSDLGEAVHLSPPAVYERVKKLERNGAIRAYTIEVDPDKLGLALRAFVRIHISHIPCEELAQTLKTFPEIVECYSSAGEESMLIKVHTTSPSSLEALLNHIRQMTGVERVLTSIILTTHFQRENIPEG